MTSNQGNHLEKEIDDHHMASCEAPHHDPLRPTLVKSKAIRKKLSEIVISRRQMLILIQKALQANGLGDLAEQLGERTLGQSEHDGGHRLIALVRENDIETAIASIPTILADENSKVRQKTLELLLRYHYRTIVEEGNQIEALRFLRANIKSLGLSNQETLSLTLPLMFPQGTSGATVVRSSVSIVDAINELVPCTACADPGRLERLLKYAIIFQRDQCLLHACEDYGSLNYTLFRDHFCDGSLLPSRVEQRTGQNNSAAWHVQFSHNGGYIAVCSREKALLVLNRAEHLRAWVRFKRFSFTSVPAFFRWSPDDTMILVVTACGRYMVFVTHLESVQETLVHTTMINETVTCADWLPDSRRLVIATIDGNVYVTNIDGQLIQTLHGFRTTALLVIENGGSVLLADHLKRLVVWSLCDSATRCIWQDEEIVNGISPCKDPNEVLLSVRGRGVFLFSIRYLSVVRTFPAFKLHGSGGAISFMPGSESKIFCGCCETGHLGYWHLDRSEPLKTVRDTNPGNINSVTWSPADRHTVITASDDGTLTVWRSISAELC